MRKCSYTIGGPMRATPVLLFSLTAILLSSCRFVAMGVNPSETRSPASIELNNQPLPTHINSAAGFSLTWQASGDEDVVSVQESSDGITWHEITAISIKSSSVTIDPNDVSLPDGDVKLRVQVGETLIDLGSVTVDRTPPVVSTTLDVGGTNGLYFGCPAAMSFFGSATDNLIKHRHHLHNFGRPRSVRAFWVSRWHKLSPVREGARNTLPCLNHLQSN